jgi:hypothetical protein
LLVGLSGLLSCSYISFQRPPTDDEILLRQSLKAYYNEVQSAFAAGNPAALASLFSPSITRPMTQGEIRAWADKFFAEHGRARFKIKGLEIEELSFVRAVVTLTYSVETPDGKGGFAGTERDILERARGRWSIAAWDKL